MGLTTRKAIEHVAATIRYRLSGHTYGSDEEMLADLKEHNDKHGWTMDISSDSPGNWVRHEGVTLDENEWSRAVEQAMRAERGRGRPEVGPTVQVRLEPSLLAAVDRETAREGESRAYTIRELVREALETRARQAPPHTVIVTLVDGETDTRGGIELGRYGPADLPSLYTDEMVSWMESCGMTDDNPRVWALVEIAEDAGGRSANQLDFREITVTPGELFAISNEIAEQDDQLG